MINLFEKQTVIERLYLRDAIRRLAVRSNDKRSQKIATRIVSDYLLYYGMDYSFLISAIVKALKAQTRRTLKMAAGVATNYIYSNTLGFGVAEHPIPKKICEQILALKDKP